MSYFPVSRVVYTSSIRRFEFCFAVLGLLFYSGGLTNVLTSAGAHVVATPVRYGLLVGSFYGICLNRAVMWEAIRRGRWIWPLTLLTIISFLWASNSAVAIQSLRSEFIPISLFGLYFAIRFSRQEIFRILYVSTLIASIASLFYALAIPSIGKHPLEGQAYPGAWRGIFSHKNGLGVNLTINAALVGIKILYEERKKLRNNLLIYLFLSVEIIFSKSLSSLMFSIVVIGLIWIYRNFKWKGRLSVLLLYWLSLVLIGVSGVVNVFWNPLMRGIGKDPTLSARTLIWDYIMNQHVARQPILGFGRGALWSDPSFFSGLYRAVLHTPPHAHNGYVDLIFDLGYVGLLCFLVSLFPVLFRVLKLAYAASNKEDVMPLAIIIILLISNVTESVLLRGASFIWLLYLTVSCVNLEKSKPDQFRKNDYIKNRVPLEPRSN